ncbi:hypothetical protein [Mucilaginibacter psychrotolerans]|uniref:Uncharacterized protein n=1 Tax=Mucilaginibacter psychrotolerans TaxID=1524096 RepID=A0A4Y8S9P6_9SPHI|nr:hypothetical protein [Mucilaginibacter psychrotolerans]TFF35749.1 hypothetical protein E2R66_17665 [Mucilaginibacter psychrotolerans]
MKNAKETERLAEETLNSLDNLQTIEPEPFLFTRIQSRIARKNEAAIIQNRVSMYRLAAVLICILFINIISYQAALKAPGSKPGSDVKAAFANEYHLEDNFYAY